MTIGVDLSSRKNRGEFLSVWRLIDDLGSAPGPLLIGVRAKFLALSGALGLCFGVGVAGSLARSFAVEETLKKPSADSDDVSSEPK